MLHHPYIFTFSILLIGIAIGFFGKAFIVKEEGVSRTQLGLWRQRLSSALTGDAAKLKLEAENILSEIKAKL